MPSEFVSPFLGVMPRVSPELLGQNYAQTALNCSVDRGLVESARGGLATGTTMRTQTKAIYLFNRDGNGGNGFWFDFSVSVDVLRGQIANDPYLRTYIFGNGAPKYTTLNIATSGAAPYPSSTRVLGLPSPPAPAASGPTGDAPGGSTKVSTAYVVTYVSDIGEEGPPSPPSNIVDRWDGGANVSLTGIGVASGDFVIAAKRIYRIELNGVYQYVGEVAAAVTTFDDSVYSESLGEPIATAGWIAPSDQITGAVSLPNGIIMAWWKNTIAFCEPYYPYAWPVEYRLALDYDVVGACVTQNGVIVCTKGKPYLITGSTPAGMAQNPIDTTAACLSKCSIVDMGEFALYAGADGLIAAGGMKAEVITREFITPEQWRSTYSPGSIIGCKYKDYYLGFYTGGSFLFKPGIGFLNFSETARAVLADDQTGDVYYLASDNALKKWDQGSPLSFTWRGRRIRVANMSGFNCAKVDALAYPVTFKFFTDGLLAKELSVTSKKSFRLPNFSRYRNCEFEVSGSNPILSVQLATSMSEIA